MPIACRDCASIANFSAEASSELSSRSSASIDASPGVAKAGGAAIGESEARSVARAMAEGDVPSSETRVSIASCKAFAWSIGRAARACCAAS